MLKELWNYGKSRYLKRDLHIRYQKGKTSCMRVIEWGSFSPSCLYSYIPWSDCTPFTIMYFVFETNLQQDKHLSLLCPMVCLPPPLPNAIFEWGNRKESLNCSQETWIWSPIDRVTLGGHLAPGGFGLMSSKEREWNPSSSRSLSTHTFLDSKWKETICLTCCCEE